MKGNHSGPPRDCWNDMKLYQSNGWSSSRADQAGLSRDSSCKQYFWIHLKQTRNRRWDAWPRLNLGNLWTLVSARLVHSPATKARGSITIIKPFTRCARGVLVKNVSYTFGYCVQKSTLHFWKQLLSSLTIFKPKLIKLSDDQECT